MKNRWPGEYGIGAIFSVICLVALGSSVSQFVNGAWVFGVLDLLVTGAMGFIAYAFFRSGRVDR